MKKLFSILLSLFSLYFVQNAHADFSLTCNRIIDEISRSEEISSDDFLYALNWLYAGYQRSVATIHAQKINLELLDASWKSWQIITHRRRNPSKSAPHADALQTLILLSEKTQEILERYEKILDEYNALSTRIFTSHCIKNKTICSLLDTTKAESRAQITYALTDVKTLIEECSSLNWIFKGVSRLHDLEEINIDELDDQEITTRSILSDIQEKLPIIAFNSFVTTDIGFVKASDSHWALLYNVQCASNSVWKAIETARSSVLKYAYEQLYTVMHEHGITPIYISSTAIHHAEQLPHTLE